MLVGGRHRNVPAFFLDKVKCVFGTVPENTLKRGGSYGEKDENGICLPGMRI